MANPKLPVKFFRSNTGREPVRDWLKSLPGDTRKAIGDDIRTVQFGWPLGMPLVRKMEEGLWEVRITLRDGIARVLFTIVANQVVLLHGFIKKTQRTPSRDLETARRRRDLLR